MEDFERFRKEVAEIIRQNENVCREGYRALLMSKDYDSLCAVIRKYFAELNRSLWSEFQAALQKYYKIVGRELEARNIFYNVPCDNGLCMVDRYCEYECLVLRGMAKGVCHDNSSVMLMDQAQATLLDHSRAVARDSSSVNARMHSYVEAKDYSTVRADDNAKVVSDGSTNLYMYSSSQLRNLRSRKLDVGVSARIVEPYEDWN